MPAVNEWSCTLVFQQGELYQFCLDHNIQPIGYSPIGSPKRPERDRTPDDLADTEQPVVVEIAPAPRHPPSAGLPQMGLAARSSTHPVFIQPEQVSGKSQMRDGGPSQPREMEQMRSVERNCRLIKGQVFLWEGAGSWLDLWDIDGTIPGGMVTLRNKIQTLIEGEYVV
jgi:hypothetical protein